MTPAAASKTFLTVSVVLFQSDLALLSATLASLVRAVQAAVEQDELQGAELLLVDNTGREDYAEAVRAALASLPTGGGLSGHYIATERNLGFGGGHNLALGRAQGNAFLVLNPDVELRPDSLARGMARLRQDADSVILSPLVQNEEGAREYLCKRYPSVLVLFLRAFAPARLQALFAARLAHYEARDLCGDCPAAVPLASGCFMLMRTADLRHLEGFDEEYFLYFEDFDLSLRAAHLGQVLYFPGMVIVHHGGYAASKGLRHIRLFLAAGLRFFRRHGWQWI